MSEQSAAERNFSNFVLGDDPVTLADSVLFEMALRIGVRMESWNPGDYGRLVHACGANKELRTNRDPKEIWDVAEAADLVETSGLLQPLNRSLQHPDVPVPPDAAYVMSGNVANWMDRGAAILKGRAQALDAATETGGDSPRRSVHLMLGKRLMTSPTEVDHSNVRPLASRLQRAPTETEYGVAVTAPRLQLAGFNVGIASYDTTEGSVLAARFIQNHGELFAPGKHLAAVRVAGAGVQLACTLRAGARRLDPNFDANPEAPQIYILTDTIKLARTEAQLANPREYQSPYTALRQLAVTAKMLAEARTEQHGPY